MATEVIATIANVFGEVLARDADGNVRVLAVGDEIYLGEEIITADGAFIALSFEDGSGLMLAGDEQVTITEDLPASFEPDPPGAAIGQATVEEIIAALERGEDITDLLPPPGAGAEGGGDNGGGKFVRIARIDEPVPPVAYNFPGNDFPGPGIAGGLNILEGDDAVDDDDDTVDDDDDAVDDDDDTVDDDDDGHYPGISHIAIGYADGTVVKYEEGEDFQTEKTIDDEDFVRQFADDMSDGEWVAAYVKGGQEDLEYFNEVEGTFDWPKNPGGQVVDADPDPDRWSPDDDTAGDDDAVDDDDDTVDDDDDDQGGGHPPHAGGPGGPQSMSFQAVEVESDDDDMVDNPLVSDEGADVFTWNSGDAGDPGEPSEYTIQGFTLGAFGEDPEADKLDLADLLQDENEEAIDQYIMAVEGDGNTVLYVSSSGGLDGDQANADQMITLEGVDMGGMDSSEFIQSLIDNGQLSIDQ